MIEGIKELVSIPDFFFHEKRNSFLFVADYSLTTQLEMGYSYLNGQGDNGGSFGATVVYGEMRGSEMEASIGENDSCINNASGAEFLFRRDEKREGVSSLTSACGVH